MDISGQAESKIALPCLCSIQALNGLDNVHPHWVEQTFIPQTTVSDANLFQRHTHRHARRHTPRIMLYQPVGHPSLSPGIKTQETIHHNPGTFFLQ